MNTNTQANTNTNTTNQEVNSMEDANKSALVSTMAAEMFHNGLTPQISLLTSAAFIGAIDYIDDMELFMEFFVNGLEITEIDVKDSHGVVQATNEELDGEAIMAALVTARYLVDEHQMGDRLAELCELRTEAYAPTLASMPIERRFGYAQVAYSPLFVEATHALEDTEYTVDDSMLSIALQVQERMGGEEKDPEAYVIRGCQKMDSNLEYHSEFKGDKRGRQYQAACHGPNGQSSDRSRALMDLTDVSLDYNAGTAKELLRAEIMDMVNVGSDNVGKLMGRAVKDPVAFIVEQVQLKEADMPHSVSKPWSFTKAALIWKELCDGNRPYIGMAIGLDAKCSGPQLGALMAGDQRIAAACGMTDKEMDDAYHLAIEQVAKAGFGNISRADIKKPYMGIFYGQGWMAFTDPREVSKEIWASLYGENNPAQDDIAKRFHKAVVASFGKKINAIRQLIKGYAKKTEGRTKHFMPDGFEVAMNYKHHVNAMGEVMDYETEAFDVHVRNNADTYKFINFQLRTSETHEGDFARNGYVNMIQATDALIARLIIVNCKRLGVQHIISVHDCFRVNIHDMEKLKQAIQMAYMELFGAPKHTVTEDLPYGTDILAMYFQGANKQLVEDEPAHMISQFTQNGLRYLQKVNGKYVRELISSLGNGAYYFAK